MDPQEILDKNGTKIRVGDRVLDVLDREQGTVIDIIDEEGEVDETGRPEKVGPFVKVLYDEGVEESWTAYWSAKGPEDMDAPYVCDDVIVRERDE